MPLSLMMENAKGAIAGWKHPAISIRLIITILILIISILSYQEVRKHHYGLDTMDFNDNVRKDFNYG